MRACYAPTRCKTTWQSRFKEIARDYAGLPAEERAKTIVIDPSVKGRARLNQDIRGVLTEKGELGPTRLNTETLRRVGLTRAEAKETVSYVPGSVVRFRRGYRFEDGALAKGEYLRVAEVRDSTKIVLSRSDGARVTWRPGQKGSGHIEVFERNSTDLAARDRIRWLENTTLDGKTIRNGQTGTVARIDPKAGIAVVRFEGKGETGGMVRLDLTKTNHRHWSHAYAETAHAAQGRTAERVMVHAESRRINLINQKSMYVALSRAKGAGIIYTDDKAELLRGAAGRTGESPTAANREEIRRARMEADKARQFESAQGEHAVSRIMDRLARRIHALTGRDITQAAHDGGRGPLLSGKADGMRQEPQAPKLGPKMRR